MLSVRGLRGGYTRAAILRDVDLELGGDEIVAVFGANGAGKSTLLRGLSGVLPVCSGEVLLEGRPLHRLGAAARVKAGLAHVPEGRHVFGAMTVDDNLAVAGLVRRGPDRRDEVYALFPRLGERRTQPAGSLSGGEQQMLAIGRALMTWPTVLLIDEMSAGLAPVRVQELVEGLTRLRGTGVSCLLVEQSPHYVAATIDRAYLIEGGRMVGHGTLDELGGADAIARLYLGVGLR
jgi:branched-chain amino acid transport system ATP-binding protein